MRKLSTIIALALVITIGGVYAAWNYSVGTVSVATKDVTVELALKVEKTDAKGAIETSVNPNFIFKIDDKSEVLKNDGNDQTNPTVEDEYVAVIDASGEWVFKFVPGEDAPLDVADGIDLKITITVKDSGTYNGLTILAPADDNVIEIAAADSLNDYTLTAGAIMEKLVFLEGETVKLGTPAEYDAFNLALTGCKVEIVISEA